MVQALRVKMKEQKGFTLIELLAVIVILGIIAAIAIPSVNSIITKSKDNALKADAKQIINSAKIYKADHDSVSSITKADLEAGYIDPVSTFAAYTLTVANDGTIKLYGLGNKDNKRYLVVNGNTLNEIDTLAAQASAPASPPTAP